MDWQHSLRVGGADAAEQQQAWAEIVRLREEIAELTDEAFREIAHLCTGRDPRAGWWDSCARSTARNLGDRLVELGKWERHPDGWGRRWFYRPINEGKAVKAKEPTDG